MPRKNKQKDTTANDLNKLIAFLEGARETGLEENGVDSELGVEEGHVTIETGQMLHTNMSLLEVSVVS